jgi:flagella basal body P-ring formation protein FlgA
MVLAALRRERGGLDGITYTVPASIRVRRASQEVGESAVRQVVEEFLREALGAGAKDAVLRSVELPGPIRVPAGAWRARVVPPAGAPLLGRVRLQIEFLLDDRPVKSVWITADVGLYGPVVVAGRPVARGEALASADLTVERRDLSTVARGGITDPAEAARMVARAPLAPFTPIRRDQLTMPAVVRRGDVVMLVAERGVLRITALGEVREDAGVGDQVRVTNRSSRKELVGHVLDQSTVAVDF